VPRCRSAAGLSRERSEKAPAQAPGGGLFLLLGKRMRRIPQVRFQTIGEGDECTCPQCRGAELPQWLARLGERVDEPAEGERIR